MSTSGTTNFTLNLNDLVEESFERVGAELRTGYDLRTARRSINLMTADWANRGLNLWTISEGSIPLVQGQIVYDLPADTVDLLDHVVRTFTGLNQQDITISRISESTYSAVPNKNAQGRPVQVWINRRGGQVNEADVVQYPQISLWPVPDQNDYYTFVYWRMRRMQDMTTGITTPDIPFRFLPAFVAGLAYYLALKLPGGMDRIQVLKDIYDEEFQRAADEDREKASLMIVPRIGYI